MPDDTAFVQRIATAEKNGNHKEAFELSIDFIYGDPGLLTSSNAAGWKDRAVQLSADLVAQNLIPPFNIVAGNGIEVNAEIPTTQTPDGVRHVSYASGLSVAVDEFKSVTISEPTGGLSGKFIWNAEQQLYVEDRATNPRTVKLDLNPNDLDQPTLSVNDPGDRTVTVFNDNGDKIFSRLGSEGQSLRSTTELANGLRIDIEGPPESPARKVITYPDGTTILMAATNVGWTTTINATNYHGGNPLHLTYEGDITNGQAQLPPNLSFYDSNTNTNYSIDNQTLSLSVTPAVGAAARYYMSGIQPEIDQDSLPVLQQPTATPSGPIATPVSAFG